MNMSICRPEVIKNMSTNTKNEYNVCISNYGRNRTANLQKYRTEWAK